MTSHRHMRRFGDYEDATENQVDKGGVLFTAQGGGAEVKNNTVNQVTINFNIQLDGLDPEKIAQLQDVLAQLKSGIPALEDNFQLDRPRHKRRWT